MGLKFEKKAISFITGYVSVSNHTTNIYTSSTYWICLKLLHKQNATIPNLQPQAQYQRTDY